MSQNSFDVVIVGAGHGGAQTAIALRQKGYKGAVAIVTDEHYLPYERPPLSKEYLAGKKPFGRLLIRPAAYWADNQIKLLLDKRVATVDAAKHELRTDAGEEIGYGKMVWAAGGRARHLPCAHHDMDGVYSIRTRADVDQIVSGLDSVTEVVVVGGGYIGLEAAAVLTQLGKRASVLEARDRLLSRVAGPTISSFYEAEHRRRGVDIWLNSHVERFEANGNGRIAGVLMTDGTFLSGQMVIVGVGISPVVEPMTRAGARSQDPYGGVVVDEYCQTSLPDVYAVGDCALHSNSFAGGALIRLESVQNANDMATVVATHITGDHQPYISIPWFWSQQYDLRLQTVGILTGFDREVVQGDPASGAFSVAYMQGTRPLAFDCVNTTKDFVRGRAALKAEFAGRN